MSINTISPVTALASAAIMEASPQETTDLNLLAAQDGGAPETQLASANVQLSMEIVLKSALAEFGQVLVNRENLLLSLPPSVRQPVQEMLQQSLDARILVSQGLVSLVRGQTRTGEKLVALANLLAEASSLSPDTQDGYPAGTLRQFLGNFQAEYSGMTDTQRSGGEKVLLAMVAQLLAQDKTDRRVSDRSQSNLTQKSQPEGGANTGNLIKDVAPSRQSTGFSTVPADTTAENKNPEGKVLAELSLNQPDAGDEDKTSPATRANVPPGTVPSGPNGPDTAEARKLSSLVTQFTPGRTEEMPAPATGRQEFVFMENERESFGQPGDFEKLFSGIKQMKGQLLSEMDGKLSAPEKIFLDKLIKFFSLQAPASLREAAKMFVMPELFDAWVLMKLPDAAKWLELDARKMRQSADSLRELGMSLQKQEAPADEGPSGTNATVFTVPMYFGNPPQPYPAYVHIYREKDGKGGSAVQNYDVWLRISLATENVGIVDMTFHYYQGDQVDVKVNFADEDEAAVFAAYLPDLQNSFGNSSLQVTNIQVEATGRTTGEDNGKS
ncbi:Hypothetical protein LUCI_0843 [Lucifera butyrica]|uniref:Uncharacterized protein n=1 Tax=Lucifera butyrica TaxID=1351585 RepID=A0A498R5Z9_9FIRM|nr:flagellar hook-length control protein FliK [Lucifera butyrica]VBB05633.1 Hypothetical protein LUCI_0843 [Lucifera butyrica]